MSVESDFKISVLGQGFMGSAIAAQLARGGRAVQVWNRTKEKCEAAVSAGATIAQTAEEAISRADLAIFALDSAEVAGRLLSQSAAESPKCIVSIITATPGEVRRLSSLALTKGFAFLNVQLMFFPSLLGKPSSRLVASGNQDAFHAYHNVLEHLAETIFFEGSEPGRASVIDTAVMGCFTLLAQASFFQACAYVAREGMPLEDMKKYILAAVSRLDQSLPELAARIAGADFATSEAPISLYVRSFERFREAMSEVDAPRYLTDAAYTWMQSYIEKNGDSEAYHVLAQSN